MCEEYEEIRNYYLTAQCIYYSNFKINHELKKQHKICNNQERIKYRKKYFEKYKNSWLEVPDERYLKRQEDFNKIITANRKKLTCLNKHLSKIFDYNIVSKNIRHELLFNLNIEVCPYCNRNYISNYEKEDKKYTTADLDHFLPKSIFSLFSLSLYNFVPSCQICNSRFKLDKGIKIMHPYLDKIDYKNFNFEYILNKNTDISTFFLGNNHYDIVLKCTNDQYVNNKNLFRLEELYNQHKSTVSDIIYKKEAYNESYKDLMNQMFHEMNLTEEQINIFLYGIDLTEESYHKKPLSKLIADIVKI